MNTRRKFLQNATVTLASTMLGKSGSASEPIADATLTIDPEPLGAAIPIDFVGLSYEVMQLEDPSFFSAANTGLVQAFRDLNPRGILRLGGNTSEFSWWKGESGAAPPPRKSPVTGFEEPPGDTLYAITPTAIEGLRSFLDATGWSCIYGLNLGYGTPESDVAEAKFVAKTLGTRLRYFQIGNEVDLFSRHLRDASTWNSATYLGQWLSISRAIQTALPNVRFGMPDVASDVTWLPKIAEAWPSVPNKPNVVALSHHHYFGGPPSNPQVNIERLMQTDPQVAEHAALGLPAARKMGVELRMTEGNSCYGGGKPGVSDVVAAALWSADYCLSLMQLGYSGVNLHGGSGHAVAVSVGGALTGEKLMTDPTLPHPKPFYTPISNEGTMPGAGNNGMLNAHYLLQPVGYGLKFAAAFGGCIPLAVHLSVPGGKPSVQASVFAARQPDGAVRVAILNKDRATRLRLSVPSFQVLTTMSGESLASTSVKLGSDRTTGKGHLDVELHSAVFIRLA